MIQTLLFFVGALIAALVAMLVIRKAMDDEGPHWAVVLLLLLIAGNAAYFGDAWMKDRAVEAETVRLIKSLDEHPVVVAMKSMEPSQYQKLVKAVKDSEEAPPEERKERLEASVPPIANTFANAKLKGMDDDVALKFGEAFATTFIDLAKSHPQDCAQRMQDGMKTSDDMRALMGAQKFDATMHVVLYGQTVTDPKVMDDMQKRMLLLYTMPAVALENGMQIGSDAKPSPQQICSIVGGSMLRIMKSMPKAEAAAFVRSYLKN